jgi:hypothetical protein
MPVSLAWTRAPEAIGSDDTKTALATARETVTAWASTKPDTAVLNVTGSAKAITVTLIGRTKPDIGTLQTDLRTGVPRATITIQWVSGGLLVIDAPTSTPTPTPSPTPTTGSARHRRDDCG